MERARLIRSFPNPGESQAQSQAVELSRLWDEEGSGLGLVEVGLAKEKELLAEEMPSP